MPLAGLKVPFRNLGCRSRACKFLSGIFWVDRAISCDESSVVPDYLVSLRPIVGFLNI